MNKKDDNYKSDNSYWSKDTHPAHATLAPVITEKDKATANKVAVAKVTKTDQDFIKGTTQTQDNEAYKTAEYTSDAEKAKKVATDNAMNLNEKNAKAAKHQNYDVDNQYSKDFIRAFNAAEPKAIEHVSGLSKGMSIALPPGTQTEITPTPATLMGASASFNFCDSWPRVKTFINMAIGVLGFFYKQDAVAAHKFVNAFEAVGLPLICPPAE